MAFAGYSPIIEAWTQGAGGLPGSLIATSVAAEGARFGGLRVVGEPWFEASAKGGIGKGEVVLASSEFDDTYPACPVDEGDLIVFRPGADADYWAHLRVVKIRRDQYQHTLSLEGDSYALHGRPALEIDGTAKGFPNEALPTAYPRNIVEWLFTTGGLYYFYTEGGHARSWYGNRDISAGDTGVALTIEDGGGTVADVLEDLAQMAGGWVWGITGGEAPEFYFRAQTATAQAVWNRGVSGHTLTMGAVVAAVLNWPGSQTADPYNVIEAVGRDERGELRVVRRDDGAIAAAGGLVRRHVVSVPGATRRAELQSVADALLAKYANPVRVYEPIQMIIGSATAVPWPWGGTVEVVSNEEDDGDLLPVQRLRIILGESPIAELTVGLHEPGEWFGGPGALFSRAKERSRDKGEEMGRMMLGQVTEDTTGESAVPRYTLARLNDMSREVTDEEYEDAEPADGNATFDVGDVVSFHCPGRTEIDTGKARPIITSNLATGGGASANWSFWNDGGYG